MKEASLTQLHNVLFYVFETLEKAKFWRQKEGWHFPGAKNTECEMACKGPRETSE